MLNKIFEKLANSDKRFVDFHGMPIREPYLWTFWRCAQFKTAAALTAVPVTAAFMSGEHGAAGYYALQGISAYAAGQVFNWLTPEFTYRVQNFQEPFCIDKRGRKAKFDGTMIDLQRPVRGCAALHLAYVAAGVVDLYTDRGGASWRAYADAVSNPENYQQFFRFMITSTVIAAHWAGMHRFANINIGRWAIVKMPPMQEVRQENERKLPDAIPEVT